MRRFVSFIALVVMVLSSVVVGCGSSNQSILVDSGSPNTPPVTGNFVLGRYVSGGSAVLETFDGEQLAQTEVGSTGGFVFASVALPARFRVRVTPPGGQVSFLADVERSDQGSHVWVNVPSSLISLDRQANPGLSLADSEARVRSLLGVPAPISLDSGLSESARSPFSHLAFFVEASANGGWTSFSAALLSEMSGLSAQGFSPQGRFRAQRADLSAPLEGLEGGLQQHAVALRGYRPLVLSLAGEATKSVLGFVAKSLGESVLGEIVDGGVKAAWTAIAEHFGLNYGTQVALQEIEEELGEVIQDLSAIETRLSDAEYQRAANALETSIAYLRTISEVKTSTPGSRDGFLAQAMSEAEANDLPSDKPISAPSDLSDIGKLLSQIEAFETVVDLEEIADFQLPGAATVNMNELWRQNKVDAPLAVQADARFMGMPFRSNSWLDVALTNFNFYSGYQQLGGKWLADSARQGTNPASDIAGVASQIDRLAISLKAQRGQFPAYLPSDEVIVDLQFGIMWYSTMQSPQTASGAKAAAEQFCLKGADALGQSLVYDDWRLPCYNELKALQDRGRFCVDVPSNTGIVPLSDNLPYGDKGTATVGLAGLGFEGVADALNSKDNGGNAKDGGMWFQSYTEYDGWGQQDVPELEFNHPQKINRKSSSDKRPFLICRSIERPVLNAQDPSQPNQDPTVIAETFPKEMTPNPVAPSELPSLGVPTTVAIAQGTQSQLNATVTYTLYLGGDFQTGNDISSAPQSAYQYSSATEVPVLNPGSSGSPEFNPLVLLPWYSSSSALLMPSNYPPAYDPDDDTESFSQALNSFGSSGFFLKSTDNPAPINATLTASVQGYVESTDTFPVALSGSSDAGQTGAYDDGLTRQPNVLQISPRNRLYDTTSPLLDGGVIAERYSCSLFYKNLTVSSQTASVQWRLLDDKGERYTGSAARLYGRLGPDPGLLELDLTQISSSGETFSIRAELTLGTGASAVTLTDTVSFLVNGTLSATD